MEQNKLCNYLDKQTNDIGAFTTFSQSSEFTSCVVLCVMFSEIVAMEVYFCWMVVLSFVIIVIESFFASRHGKQQ